MNIHLPESIRNIVSGIREQNPALASIEKDSHQPQLIDGYLALASSR